MITDADQVLRSKAEWTALKNLEKRTDIVIKAADRGDAVIVCLADLKREEAIRYFSKLAFFDTEVDKDLTSANQNRSGNHP